MSDPGGHADEIPTEPSQRPVFGGRYAVSGELGRGGMGRVLLARDLKLGRDVALKVLPAGAHTAEQRLRFEQEARAAGSLNHPNVLAVYDIGEQAGEPYIVSELLEGKTLRAALPVAPGEVLDLAVQLASGLAAAHRKGIVHRDVKPENLFLTQDGQLKILDFGIAKLLPQVRPEGPKTDTGAAIGTPAYMSPEQVRGEQVDARSDVFSSGVVLHELLAGRAPFGRPTSVETAYAILHDPPAALPGSALSDVVARCLEKDPALRYADAGELFHDLTAVAQGARTLAGKRLRRRVTLIAAAGLAGALAVAIGVRRLYPTPGPQARLRVAVADFSNETGDPDLGGLSGMMITSLEQSKRLSVLTRGTMYEVLGRLGERADRIDEPLARELARRTDLGIVVLGSVRRFGEVYVIDVKLLDPDHNEYVFAAKEQGRTREEIPALIDRLSERVRVRLDEPAQTVREGIVPVARSTTANLEAYRHFFAGEQWRQRGESARAKEELKAAVAVDPEFALAYLRFWQAQDWGELNAEADAALLKALELSDRLPASALCTARAAEALYRHRPADAKALQLDCARRYPDDRDAVETAAQYASASGDLATAERLYLAVRPTEALDAIADADLWDIWSARGDFERLRADAAERARKTRAPEASFVLARAQAALGDEAGAEQTIDALSRLDPEGTWVCQIRLMQFVYAGQPERAEALLAGPAKCPPYARNQLDVARGRYAKVLAALKAEASLAISRGRPLDAFPAIARQARLRELLGDTGAWRKAATEATALGVPSDRLSGLYLEAGMPEELIALREARLIPRFREFDFDLRVAIARAIATGRIADGIAADEKFTHGVPRHMAHFDLGAEYLKNQDPAKAIALLEPLLALTSFDFSGSIDLWGRPAPWARISYVTHGLHTLGVAYEQVGNKAAAREPYERLLRLWSDADPDIPDLIDTRARLAALH